ncbi:MAG: hypothetical protein LBT89_10890 [Planctomycetaceae bacterium]|jgi:hypothetical protein|nr:hypothetical protein [Planctomycetaceae bacterium]
MMNHWTELSITFANQRNYLDELFRVYSIVPEKIREIDQDKWKQFEKAFANGCNGDIIKTLLKLKLFPIKDSYVAYLKKDATSIVRNPKTIDRLCAQLREMGLDKIWEKCSEPKETNRQIGPLFRRWLEKKELGFPLLNIDEFRQTKDDAVLIGSDAILADFARSKLDYRGEKGLDFLARVRKTYIIGEAKFLTDFGGHQNAQFEYAKNLLQDNTAKAVKIAILDGVLYITGRNKMFSFLKSHKENYNILSCLLLREFLHQI